MAKVDGMASPIEPGDEPPFGGRGGRKSKRGGKRKRSRKGRKSGRY